MSKKFIEKIKDRMKYHADETRYRYEIGKAEVALERMKGE